MDCSLYEKAIRPYTAENTNMGNARSPKHKKWRKISSNMYTVHPYIPYITAHVHSTYIPAVCVVSNIYPVCALHLKVKSCNLL